MGNHNKGMKFDAQPILGDVAVALLKACGDDWIGVRDRAVLVVMYRGGLRVGEACGLELGAVRRVPGGFIVRVTKPKGYKRGKKPREVAIGQPWAEALERWLEHRGAERGPLFLTTKGKGLQTSHYRRLMKTLARRAGIEQRVHPHGLRHGFTCDFYRDHPDRLMELMLALGHTKLSITQGYMKDIGAHDVIPLMLRRAA